MSGCYALTDWGVPSLDRKMRLLSSTSVSSAGLYERGKIGRTLCFGVVTWIR